MSPAEIEAFLHEKIPLARAMGVRVESSDAETFILTAPLEPNHNHLGTAFGGSLAALATLTGYACLWHSLDDRDAHVVIRRSELDYRHPVTGTLRAICRRPDERKLADFRATFAKAGKARISLEVEMEEAGRICLHFRGDFVAVR
ncbi:thioesterase domain-containing protein [Luteolibacter flavescens]|uniref:Thioesterase domain-containing protein n=1 Tax=Luteolibacter flavescens TaxID=1859460 RepID=A0ABT3FUH0_9BACT|nr:thioesterase domain-containing protein [Luteolibacter flavescens]MCW1887238.1 thioesterase domain-containing protein [Luteolibacter flavescens]